MDNETKFIFGKMFGEVYKIQNELGICKQSDSHIFGLLNGFEESLENEFTNLSFYSNDKVNKVREYLAPYYKGEVSLDEMPNFTEFRMRLETHEGIKHAEVIDILKFLYNKGAYQREINKLGDYRITSDDI